MELELAQNRRYKSRENCKSEIEVAKEFQLELVGRFGESTADAGRLSTGIETKVSDFPDHLHIAVLRILGDTSLQ